MQKSEEGVAVVPSVGEAIREGTYHDELGQYPPIFFLKGMREGAERKKGREIKRDKSREGKKINLGFLNGVVGSSDRNTSPPSRYTIMIRNHLNIVPVGLFDGQIEIFEQAKKVRVCKAIVVVVVLWA
jgi:hypothetical protein